VKPPPFAYHDPRTIEDAVALLARLDNARPLAGGQSLMPMLNMRYAQPDHLVDLNRIPDLSGVTEEADGSVVIGAMTRQRTLERSDVIARRVPIMAEALRQVGHLQTRNRGTIGGSLCHLDPAAELPLIAAATDASIAIAGPRGRRDLPFEEFPAGFMTPALAPDELVVSIRIPPLPRHGHAFLEYARRHGDFAIVAVAVMLMPDGAGRIAGASVTLGGVGAAPVRLAEAEAALAGMEPSATVFSRAAEATRALAPMEDALVPAWYRRHLARVLLERALASAQRRLLAT
jgi:carbon-monoxide dehydrogenase medium subunit